MDAWRVRADRVCRASAASVARRGSQSRQIWEQRVRCRSEGRQRQFQLEDEFFQHRSRVLSRQASPVGLRYTSRSPEPFSGDSRHASPVLHGRRSRQVSGVMHEARSDWTSVEELDYLYRQQESGLPRGDSGKWEAPRRRDNDKWDVSPARPAYDAGFSNPYDLDHCYAEYDDERGGSAERQRGRPVRGRGILVRDCSGYSRASSAISPARGGRWERRHSLRRDSVSPGRDGRWERRHSLRRDSVSPPPPQYFGRAYDDRAVDAELEAARRSRSLAVRGRGRAVRRHSAQSEAERAGRTPSREPSRHRRQDERYLRQRQQQRVELLDGPLMPADGAGVQEEADDQQPSG